MACCLLAAAALAGAPARAECILQPDGATPEGMHWSLHYDAAKNRRCWVLVNATSAAPAPSGAAAAPPAAPAPTTLESFFGNLMGRSPPAAPPAAAPPPAEAAPVRRAQAPAAAPGAAAAPKPAAAPKRDYRDMTPEQRDALFGEFMRWHDGRPNSEAAKDQPQ